MAPVPVLTSALQRLHISDQPTSRLPIPERLPFELFELLCDFLDIESLEKLAQSSKCLYARVQAYSTNANGRFITALTLKDPILQIWMDNYVGFRRRPSSLFERVSRVVSSFFEGDAPKKTELLKLKLYAKAFAAIPKSILEKRSLMGLRPLTNTRYLEGRLDKTVDYLASRVVFYLAASKLTGEVELRRMFPTLVSLTLFQIFHEAFIPKLNLLYLEYRFRKLKPLLAGEVDSAFGSLPCPKVVNNVMLSSFKYLVFSADPQFLRLRLSGQCELFERLQGKMTGVVKTRRFIVDTIGRLFAPQIVLENFACDFVIKTNFQSTWRLSIRTIGNIVIEDVEATAVNPLQNTSTVSDLKVDCKKLSWAENVAFPSLREFRIVRCDTITDGDALFEAVALNVLELNTPSASSFLDRLVAPNLSHVVLSKEFPFPRNLMRFTSLAQIEYEGAIENVPDSLRVLVQS